jgi:hypothetical protein
MGEVHGAILSLQEFQQFAQGDIRKLFEETGQIDEIPLAAALADGDEFHQCDVMWICKRAALRMV